MEAMEGFEDGADSGSQSVREIAKLADSDKVRALFFDVMISLCGMCTVE